MNSIRSIARAFERLTCLLISLSLVDCTSESTAPTQTHVYISEGLIPFRVGNRWAFKRFNVVDSLGTLVPSDTSEIVVLKDALFNGTPWFQSNTPWPAGYAYTNKPQGCYLRGWLNNNLTTEFLEYKYPATPNESYTVPILFLGADSVWLQDSLRIVTVLSTDTLVTVPAGTFHCYQFRFQYNYPNWRESYDEFVSPGFGWIVKNYYERTAAGTPRLRATLVLTNLQVQ